MTYTVVLPSIYQPWTDACLANCKLENVLVIDNTVDNIGVAASWNKGIEKMYRDNTDWLIILSASIRFGERGGIDFAESLTGNSIAIEAGMGMGWHLIAFGKRVFDNVGTFDENFYPAYFEDIDFSHRIKRVYQLEPPYWKKVTVDVSLAGWGHGVELGRADPRTEENKDYMLRKWGHLTGTEMYDHPFNDKTKDIKYWEKP